MKIVLTKQSLYNLGALAKRKLHVLIVSAVFLLVCFPLGFSLCSSLVINTGLNERNPATKEALYLNSYARLKEKLTVDKDPGEVPDSTGMEIVFKEFLNSVISVQRFGKTAAAFVPEAKESLTEGKGTESNSDSTASLENQKEVAGTTPVKSLSDSKITLVSNANGNYEIYTSNPDGSGRARLSENGKNNNFPRFSYDLKKIVFISDSDGTSEVYLINNDGAGLLKLTDNDGFNCYPSFSPDGTKIIFQSYQGESSEIYIMNADGSGQKRLTSNGSDEIEPCFSPDGKTIAFASDMDGDYEIYIMNLNSMDIFQLTNNSSCDWEPSFSPDGSSVAFSSNLEGNYNIYLTGITGKNTRKISGDFSNANSTNPYISPDGKKIAFSSNIDGDFEIYTINFNTLETAKITDNSTDEWLYSWY